MALQLSLAGKQGHVTREQRWKMDMFALLFFPQFFYKSFQNVLTVPKIMLLGNIKYCTDGTNWFPAFSKHEQFEKQGVFYNAVDFSNLTGKKLLIKFRKQPQLCFRLKHPALNPGFNWFFAKSLTYTLAVKVYLCHFLPTKTSEVNCM